VHDINLDLTSQTEKFIFVICQVSWHWIFFVKAELIEYVYADEYNINLIYDIGI
jgi:hypothetical protein